MSLYRDHANYGHVSKNSISSLSRAFKIENSRDWWTSRLFILIAPVLGYLSAPGFGDLVGDETYGFTMIRQCLILIFLSLALIVTAG